MNLRELRTMFAHNSPHSWYRFMTDAKNVQLPDEHKPLKIIRKHVEKCKPLRFSMFKNYFV